MKYIIKDIFIPVMIVAAVCVSVVYALANYVKSGDNYKPQIAYTCDPDKYKVFESCRRLIVDEHWDDYVKHRKAVYENCTRIAEAFACTEIKDHKKGFLSD